ncbi:MAG: formyltransferase family protein, partial [Pseudomonadota bacterium]
YKGLRTHERAIAAGDKEGGCTVHFVNTGVDEGEIIAQIKVPILANDDANSLAARVLIEEHLLYPKCVDKIARSLRI